MRLGMEDAVLNLHWPIHEQAVAEFPAAFAELRERFGIADDAPVGLLGGSAGSSIAAGVLAGGETGAQAAVFVSPMLRLRSMVDVLSGFFGVDYRGAPSRITRPSAWTSWRAHPSWSPPALRCG